VDDASFVRCCQGIGERYRDFEDLGERKAIVGK
jgi:hypothetical protein